MNTLGPDDPIVALASFGLRGAAGTLPTGPLDDAAWRKLLAKVRAHRLAGHLADALAEGALAATETQVDEAVELHVDAMARVVILERVLLEATEILERTGVRHRVLKGSALAHTAYPNPSLRVYTDVDLLAASEDFDTAVAALGAAGYRRNWPQLRPGFDRRFGKAATLTGDSGQIDLHRTFLMGPFGLTVDLPSLFETATAFEVGGRRLLALGPEERFLHACYNAALGDVPPRLVSLRDVAQMLLHVAEVALDHRRVLDLARRWRGEAVVARAVTMAWDTFGLADVVPLSVWARRYEPARAEQRALDSYLKRRSYTAKALASLWVIPGVGAKTAYLRAVVLPDRAFLRIHDRGYASWLRRGGRVLLQRGGWS
ncbi:MAG: nucleotidyltransferase family protein [Actinomycetota bacterium]|nr:nucleotidyltransferase family protein [Actinomycetota bacterium]